MLFNPVRTHFPVPKMFRTACLLMSGLNDSPGNSSLCEFKRTSDQEQRSKQRETYGSNCTFSGQLSKTFCKFTDTLSSSKLVDATIF